MTRSRLIVAILSVAIAVATGLALWQANRGGSTPPPSIADVGAPVAIGSMPASQQALLRGAAFSSDLRLRQVAKDGVAVYTYRRSDGALCFLADGSGICPTSDSASLFPNGPIAAVFRLHVTPGVTASPANSRIVAWRGVAADGISAVGVVDANGATHHADVVNNTFELSGSLGHPTKLEAFNANGAVVWSQDMNWG